MTRAKIALAATIGLVTLSLSPALADDRVGVFAGGQADFSNYVFIGATLSLGPSVGNGVAVRGILDTGGYNYISDPLGTVKANFGGGELDALYQFTHQNFWSDVGVGLNDTYTGLMPYDPTNRRRGAQAEVRLSLDGGNVSGPWRADWNGFYGTRLDDYEGRIGLTHALSPQFRLGAEFYAEGDPTYSLYQVGPVAAIKITDKSELQFSAGPSWESGFASRPYFKALIYQSFP